MSRKRNDNKALDSGTGVCYTKSVDDVLMYVKPSQSHDAEHLAVPPRREGARIELTAWQGSALFFYPHTQYYQAAPSCGCLFSFLQTPRSCPKQGRPRPAALMSALRARMAAPTNTKAIRSVDLRR